jgi:NADP-dependent 3-hydroxy acid dehydrogenase YdfG
VVDAQRIALINGASSRTGKESARRLAAAFLQVFGTSRSELALDPHSRMTGLRLDVTDGFSIAADVAEVIRETGRVDLPSL